MPHRNDCKHTALLTALAVTEGDVDDLEQEWLLGLVGVVDSGEQVNDLWVELFFQSGFQTGEFNTDAYGFLLAQGVAAAALPEMWTSFWCTFSGTLIPTVGIPALSALPSCLYQPAGVCTASGDYVAVAGNFVAPVTSWVWSIESGNATITAGQGTDTVTIETQDSDENEVFTMKVIASNVGLETATAERQAVQAHLEVVNITAITEDQAGACEFPPGGKCTAQSIHTVEYSGEVTSFSYVISNPNVLLVAGFGTATITLESDGQLNQDFTITATINGNAGQDVDVSSEFTHTRTPE